jgi:hypothetical protein
MPYSSALDCSGGHEFERIKVNPTNPLLHTPIVLAIENEAHRQRMVAVCKEALKVLQKALGA